MHWFRKGIKQVVSMPYTNATRTCNFEAEHSWNYEVGLKTAFMENRIQAEASLFYIDWSNQQIYQPVPSGRGSMLKNAGESVSKGAELSMRANVFRNFNAILAYGYTDARFVTHIVDSTRNYNGNYIPYVPRHTFSMQLSHVVELPSQSFADRLKWSALYRAIGEHYWNEQTVRRNLPMACLICVWVLSGENSALSCGQKPACCRIQCILFEAIGNRYAQKANPCNLALTSCLNYNGSRKTGINFPYCSVYTLRSRSDEFFLNGGACYYASGKLFA